MVWYSHLLKNFPQFIVIHTAKGFGIVNKAEIDVFMELSCFFDDPVVVGNSISAEQLSDSVIHIHTFFFQIIFHDGLSQIINIVSCAINEDLFLVVV